VRVSSESGNATFLSMTFAGLTLGSLTCGWLADRVGRRRIFQVNLLVFGIATLAGAFSPNFHFLLICRLVSGLGLGGEVITAYGTLMEFIPAHERGRWQGRLAFLSNLGLPVSALMGWVLIPRFGWRSMFAFVGLASLIFWLAARHMPESPRWYESRRRYKEADAVLATIEAEVERRTGSKPSPVLPAAAAGAAKIRPPSITRLFRRPLFRRTILAVILMVCMNVTLYAFTAWFPTILLRSGGAISQVLLFTMLVQLGSLPGALMGTWAADRFGRKVGLILFSGSTALLGASYGYMARPVCLVLGGFTLVALIYSLLAMIYGTYVPELFPTAMRLTGFGMSTAAGRLSNVAAPYGIAMLLTSYGSASVYWAIGCILLVQTAAVTLLGEETGSRSLEQIEHTAEASG
jgi:putative MFS transporter